MLEERIDLARKPPRLQTFLFDLHPGLSAGARLGRQRSKARAHIRERQEELLREVHMNLRPLGDRLIVEVLEEEELTGSGIVLPDSAKEKPQRGRVLAVGPGGRGEDGKRVELDVAVGDEVVFAKYGGSEIKLGTEEVLILRESDVLAKVTPRTSKRKRRLAGATA
jgi:chaperonin GroES